MTRLDTDLSHTLARQLLRLFAHLLRDEEQRDAYGEILTAVQASFLTRDELAARQRKRLALPSDN